ncbi:GGDEF domain-containing protein [Aureimonas psammosilenae]|uniref:GGDEF domain-containing protein n=1 Tax=Aureimonas psammosilenae TaxID=2495496 RepID=UPI001260D899|nr:GGDEF domain-containing protein [Aureimonas psammosilenae]
MGESFAWTIPLIHFGFGVLFLAANRAGAAREARLWGIGFLLSGAAFALPMAEALVPVEAVAVSADILFALSFYFFSGALLARYVKPRLIGPRLALLGFAVAASLAAVLVIGSLAVELVLSDVTCAAQLILALVVARWPRPWLDRVLVLLSWLVVIENLVRTASIPVTAAGATFSTFSQTVYGYVMLASGIVGGIAFASCALIAVMTDVIANHRRDALIDPLTGLFNRRGLDAVAAQGRAERTDGIVICDLDRFKRVNDTWGHAVGDRVLVALSDLIRAALPPGSVAARTGGEEFVLYLPGYDLARTRMVAERLRDAMSVFEWSRTGIEGRQTASFGLAVRTSRQSDEFESALRRADIHLYEAKRRGRDQIQGFAPV